jgi:hypothetical protein
MLASSIAPLLLAAILINASMASFTTVGAQQQAATEGIADRDTQKQ